MPGSALSKQKVFTYLVNMLSKPPVKAFMSPKVAGSIWEGHRQDCLAALRARSLRRLQLLDLLRRGSKGFFYFHSPSSLGFHICLTPEGSVSHIGRPF